ncbi:GTP cyclohydrolase II [Mycolicibacterium conceptionense]|uniref:GTP cyclohydrolase II n=1 Tax=Mycolicibacterium conceptionense TaxID=451644 RepID=UPI000A86FED1|nr:GTP cyclohydrolase II [Mycolicibacterium conceptionense]
MHIQRLCEAKVRTRDAAWTLYCYGRESDMELLPIVVLVGSDEARNSNSSPLVRIQSECFTGHVLGTLSCDCRAQLDASLTALASDELGILVYLRQEGRGIGLVAKMESYNLQAAGLDTVEANLKLGYRADERSYELAAQILLDLGFDSIRLLTNNPQKSASLQESGIKIVQEVPLPTFGRPENSRYLRTKRDVMGHRLDLDTGVEKDDVGP